MMYASIPKSALLSVYDKTDIDLLARKLLEQGYNVYASEGTYQYLKEHGVFVDSVSSITGYPHLMNGLVKTLHPIIYAGILCDRNNKEHLEEITKYKVPLFDIIAVNLYPYEELSLRADLSFNDLLTYIDIGGISLIRAAVKNYQYVTILTSPTYYSQVISELETFGETSPETRMKLAVDAINYVAYYDALISHFMNFTTGMWESNYQTIPLKYAGKLRYGENPHQRAFLYRYPVEKVGVVNAICLSSRKPSLNNIGDLDAGLRIISEFRDPTCVIIKHRNPCGVASSQFLLTAFKKAYECDSKSAFGGVVVFNRNVDSDVARELSKKFFHCLMAPHFEEEALGMLSSKKSLTIFELPGLDIYRPYGLRWIKVSGGFLLQEDTSMLLHPENLRIVSKRAPTKEELSTMIYSWNVVKHTYSNAIVITKGSSTVGIAWGESSRVDAVQHAVEKAGRRAKDACLASDGFFPFRDSIDVMAEAGITAIIQPGGSKRDAEVIEAANEYGMCMIFTGIRGFNH